MKQIQLDDNRAMREDGVVICRHCNVHIGTKTDPMKYVHWVEKNAMEAGPGVSSDPNQYVDEKIVFRQAFCPSCFVALMSNVVPEVEPRNSRGSAIDA